MHSDGVAGSKGFSGMQLEIWPLSRLIPYIRNPRKNDHVVNRMVASIQEFGFRIPVLLAAPAKLLMAIYA